MGRVISTSLSLSRPKKKRGRYFLLFSLLATFCVWVVWTSLNPPLPQEGSPPRLYSNQCWDDLTLTFLQAIEKANRSIDIVMFGLTDASIIAALHQKSKEGIPTQILYDPKGSFDLKKKLPHASIKTDPRSGLMHQKVLVLDKTVVFVGSANFTTSSLRVHDNLVVGMHDPKFASFVLNKTPPGYLKTKIGEQPIECWLLPDPKGRALMDLKQHLRKAKQSIRVALFTFTHPSLVDELIGAKKRGVDVLVLIDRYSAFGASKKALQSLLKAGIEVRTSTGVQLLHHKFAWIDEETLILGSANWTKAAFCQNKDLIVALHHLTDEQKSMLESLWKRVFFPAALPPS